MLRLVSWWRAGWAAVLCIMEGNRVVMLVIAIWHQMGKKLLSHQEKIQGTHTTPTSIINTTTKMKIVDGPFMLLAQSKLEWHWINWRWVEIFHVCNIKRKMYISFKSWQTSSEDWARVYLGMSFGGYYYQHWERKTSLKLPYSWTYDAEFMMVRWYSNGDWYYDDGFVATFERIGWCLQYWWKNKNKMK